MNRVAHIAVFACLLALPASMGGEVAHAQQMLEVSVAGPKGQNFSGDCYLLKKSGRMERHRLKGVTPAKYWLPSKAVRCNFQKMDNSGFVTVSIKRGSQIEVSQKSRYPLKWVYVQSHGPWGKASGSVHPSRPIFR